MQPIIVIGVSDVESSTTVSICKAFAKIRPVIPINYRTIIWRFGMPYFERLVLDTVKKYDPYMMFCCKINGVNPQLLKDCSELTKVIYWLMDPPETGKQCGAIPLAKASHFSFCSGGGAVQWMIDEGVENCHLVFDGCDTDIFKPVPAVSNYMADISFIGAKNQERDLFLQALANNGFHTKAYGSGYSKSVINKEFAQVCNSSKMMLSMNTYNHPDYFSNRLLRYMGCGSCTLHYDPTETLKKYFKPGKEIVLFKDKEDLVEKAKSLTDEQIGNIGLGGRDRTIKHYTWSHTTNHILQRIK